MVLWKELGFNSEQEYSNNFFSKLLSSNKTYNYFVDWGKIMYTLNELLVEIGILNSLVHVRQEDRRTKLSEILKKYPKVISLIPILIAVSEKELEVYDDETKKTKHFDFKTSSSVEDVVNFCDKSGLLEIFDEIKDLYTYLFGVEVGKDTNSRKNRSGHIFEKIVETELRESLKDLPVEIIPEYTLTHIRKKRFDFVVFSDNTPIIVIECNFYNTSGSKPTEVARSYVDLQNKLRSSDLIFVWVTDGQAWIGMRDTISKVSTEIDYLLNLDMFKRNIKRLVENKLGSRNEKNEQS